MRNLYTVQDIRTAETALFAREQREDELMQSAAHAVAVVTEKMLAQAEAPAGTEENPVLLLVGPGGNGGDALYAGAVLAMQGKKIEAYPLEGIDRVHERAARAFTAAGGSFVGLERANSYRVIVDGIFGLGGRGELPVEVDEFLRETQGVHTDGKRRPRVLAIDIPSGVIADTGKAPGRHVVADVTVTFGGLRRAHGLSAACGAVLCEDIGLDDGSTLSAELAKVETPQSAGSNTSLWHTPVEHLAPEDMAAQLLGSPEPLPGELPGEPGAVDDKYSGGVVGICVGSKDYLGAGVLATLAAVNTTSSMVRYIGEHPEYVLATTPEVVVHPAVRGAGQVQARMVGSGRGTDRDARDELLAVLDMVQPLVLDADAITVLAKNPDVLEVLRARNAPTLLTPHDGEFDRLAKAAGLPAESPDRITSTERLARELNCTVLLKGRFTIIANPQRTVVVDTASSWAATPGSGDVLAGILGALVARDAGRRARDTGYTEAGQYELEAHEADYMADTAAVGVAIHATASYISSLTPYGPAPTSALKIAQHIPHATAWLGTVAQG
ncbi:bifunctional ADP-dependent NAD(P)H-hydrate dehydratase/NAD(P)H-hydrate epimerase [uncultured Corynebacterium sp.]|uniref:bifunctional ADP-dependent NAD(P)H-hydrate dehydratase/NAD(P)H-hydrate epimerase n=1 Tax=uncultured Corynebacterium sp. TaxID=159447 RepID=UPI0025F2D3A1|nr:bifunctional ADP-dependent NAD(P)H-hydrate dehydratase/NAD(P)H-hydrate epimerase [uncultured Corynebacterium sp.]